MFLYCNRWIAVVNVLIDQTGVLVDALIIVALRQRNEQRVADKITDGRPSIFFVPPMVEFGYFFFDFCQQLNGELFNLFYVLG